MKRKGSLLGLFIIYFALIAGAIILIVWPQYVYEWVTGEPAVKIERPKYYGPKIKEIERENNE